MYVLIIQKINLKNSEFILFILFYPSSRVESFYNAVYMEEIENVKQIKLIEI